MAIRSSAVATFAIYRGVHDFQELLRAPQDYKGGMEAFKTANDRRRYVFDSLNTKEDLWKKIISRLDGRVRGLELKNGHSHYLIGLPHSAREEESQQWKMSKEL